MLDGPGSFAGGCPLRRPLNLSGSSSLLLVKYCLRASLLAVQVGETFFRLC